MLLIMDRGTDLVTPLIHDDTFQPLVYDLLADKVSHDHILDLGKKCQLNNENEPDWVQLKYMRMEHLLTSLQEKFPETIKTQKSLVGNLGLKRRQSIKLGENSIL